MVFMVNWWVFEVMFWWMLLYFFGCWMVKNKVFLFLVKKGLEVFDFVGLMLNKYVWLVLELEVGIY